MITQTTERVDTWEMVVVHRVFRREFRRIPTLIRDVADGDGRQAAIVAEWLNDMSGALHHHHTAEDELLWPTLLPRVGLRAGLVERMERQHEQLGAFLDRIDELVPQWTISADSEIGGRIADLVDRASTVLEIHLAEEEIEILPLAAVHLSQSEWNALGKRGQEALPKNRKAFVFLGAILQDASPSEQAAFLRLIPAPVRLAWPVFGRKIHQRAMSRLNSRGAAR